MKVLIVKTSSLGDIIHAFPVLSFLHQEFPNVTVDWVVEKNFAEIVKAHPQVNKVIEIDTKGWRKKLATFKTWHTIWHFKKILQENAYDVVFDLQGNTKSALATFFAKSRNKVGFGTKTVHEWPNLAVTNHRFNPPLYLNVRDENLYVVQYYFQWYSIINNEKVILQLTDDQKKIFDINLLKIKELVGQKGMVCPGSAWKNKQLSYKALEVFLRKIIEHLNVSLILTWGTPEELALVRKLKEEIQENVYILDRMPLPVLQNLMSHMDFVVAMDSLPLHLAGTSGTRTFSVFGASSAEKYKPVSNRHYAMQGTCPYGKIFERRCSILRTCPTGSCIQNLTGEEVFKEFFKWNLEKQQVNSQ